MILGAILRVVKMAMDELVVLKFQLHWETY